METFMNWAGSAAGVAGILLAALLCLAGIILSCLTLSGTWLVLLAALILMPASAAPFPGWATIGILATLCIVVEILESLAGSWGVVKRGGSAVSGLVALLGGLAGMFLGALIPIPLIGSLLGMMLGSFILVFLFEAYLMRRRDKAAHIAFGTVLARVAMLLLKTAVTLGMIGYLLAGLIITD